MSCFKPTRSFVVHGMRYASSVGRCLAWLLSSALMPVGVNAQTAPPDIAFGGSIAATTDYIYRGVSQTRNEEVVQVDLHLQVGEHWVTGAWASPVEPRAGERATEVDFYTHWQQYLGAGFSGSLGATYYRIMNDPRNSSYDYLEWSVALNWRERLMLLGTWAPGSVLRIQGVGAIADANSYSLELTGLQPLSRNWSFQAGLGYFAGIDVPASGYMYGSSSLTRSFNRWQATLSYHWVESDEQRFYIPGLAGQPWALTVAWTF